MSVRERACVRARGREGERERWLEWSVLMMGEKAITSTELSVSSALLADAPFGGANTFVR